MEKIKQGRNTVSARKGPLKFQMEGCDKVRYIDT